MTIPDKQRVDVYVAELGLHTPRPTLNTEQAQRFANKIIKTKTWRSLSKSKQGVLIKVAGSKLKSYADRNNYRIDLAPIHHNKMSVIHEMAHCLTGRIYADKVDDHGPEYVGILRSLIKEMMSEKAFEHWEAKATNLKISWVDPLN